MHPSYRVFVSAVALCGLALVACRAKPEATPAPPAAEPSAAAPVAASADAPDSPIAGTRWQLVEIQSMDDAIGTTRPDDPTLYTLAFGADGQAAMRLNCNRATGSWQATPSGDGASGGLAFGPLAATQALCPPPSLDERVARDMAFVRGYLLRDGRLALSLEADAAIYLWEPAAAGEETTGRPPAD